MRVENRKNAAGNCSQTIENIKVFPLAWAPNLGKKNGFQGTDLKSKRLSNDGVKHSAATCFLKAGSGIILPSLPLKGCRFSGLPHRRINIAAPLCCGVFHFGLDDSSVVHSLTGALRGKPSGLLVPMLQSANPRGVAHPFSGGVVGFKNRSIGECTMSATQSKVLSPEVVQAFHAGRNSSDLSPADRVKAASYSSEIEQASSTPEDSLGFVFGGIRDVVIAETEHRYNRGIPASASNKGVNHERN